MTSINQNDPYPVTLPNFCNLGVSLRILLFVDGASIAAALLIAQGFAHFWEKLIDISAVVQPILLLSLLLLCPAGRWLARFSYRRGVAMIIVLESIITSATHWLREPYWIDTGVEQIVRYWLLCALTSGVLLGYFNLRNRALSPALSSARLEALQARIRPHFLFNSINAVLSLIRSDPRRAEQALEDMADLFRVAMADNRNLVTLEQELNFSRQYLDLEQLRLGNRLVVAWHTENMPADAMIPPLVLQPLLENAVYHGIEPASEPGEININIYCKQEQVHLVLRNPYHKEGRHHAGNKMALNNIRERLALHFDAEATLASSLSDNCYQVHITLPYVRNPA
ncbi:MAG: sensor histidine kinase [Burkholderiales bacterium]